MTSTDQPTTPTDTPAASTDDTATATPAAPTDTTTDNGDDGHGEAARYRRRLRDTETDLAGLTARVDAMEQRHVLRLGSGRLAQPDDLLGIGNVNLDDLRDDETGELDDAKVSDAIDALLAARPGLAAAPAAASFDSGQRYSSATPTADWQRVIRGH